MKKTALIILTIIISAAMLLPLIPAFVRAEDDYKTSLIAAGFPADYAEKLTELHKKHPAWSFVPLDVTGLSGGKYTWNYVINQETENPKTSLIPSSDKYRVMRDFFNFEQYDSGWYKASVSTVEYFMDPRNFFDEKQIFQFIGLGWSELISVDTVEAALKGTFMANAKLDDIYSDMTYAEYFLKVGKELGINPIYIAATLRNEQGTAGTSALISGACGDKLWYYYSNKVTGSENGHLINAPTSGYSEENLKSYNGLYNYFNIGAAGTGYFAIYLGAMKEAEKGTPDKAEEWGSGGAWNTRWKAIYGGAATATTRYVNDYQNTPYLQKFNIDARSSRNFWGQYMQSVYGSYDKAATFYKSFSEGGLLDLPYTFEIPVFAGMPESCPMPDGTEFAKKSLLRANDVESYELLDISKIKGVKTSYSTDSISWRVLEEKCGSVIDLGTIDLSKYSSVIIEYSVAEKFDFFTGNKKAQMGLIFDASRPLGDKSGDMDDSACLGSALMSDGKTGGYLARKYATISLKDVAHSGKVYLSAYLSSGQKFLVHNIAFITKPGYAAPAAYEYKLAEDSSAQTQASSAVDTPAEDETSAPAAAKSGCASAAAAFVILPVIACAPVLRKRRKASKNEA